MSPDERALLAAVRAAPADDLPRLVYADWLEDAGRPERAAFIRCQVAADRLHPDSNRRAELEAQAEALFAGHWVDWWGDVCWAVGLPLPERPRATRLGRLARRLWVGVPVGLPYLRNRFTVGWNFKVEMGDAAWFYRAEYSRGFPDRLELGLPVPGRDPRTLPGRWAAAGPLRDLTVGPPLTLLPAAVGGPHLAGVSRLVLRDGGPAVAAVLASEHLGHLTDLRIETTDPPDGFNVDLFGVLISPAAPRLGRLEIPLPDQASAEVLAGASSLAGLTALAIELEFEPDISGGVAGPFPPEHDRQRLETLARSPYFAGLTELQVSGVLSAAGVRALVHRPAWAGLRTLTLTPYWDTEYAGGLADATLPELIDLRLDDWGLTPEALRVLARLPLLRQLRHLRLAPRYGTPDADVLAVADALDPDRVETLAVRTAHLSARVRAELTRRFGDRVKFS